jgi:methylthioxylose transferase
VPSVAARLLLPAAALVAVATVVAGVWIHATTGRLGTATPPFVVVYEPDVAWPWAAFAVVTAAAAALTAPRLAPAGRAGLGGRVAWPVAVTLLALVPGLALGATRNGSLGWREVFLLGPGGSFEASNEYLAGLPALSYGPRLFVDRFSELVPSLPVNVAGHPPGLMLVVDALGLTSAGRLAALCIACAVALPGLTLLLARGLGLPVSRARVAAVLAALSPAVLLIGITSGDAVFAAVGAGTAVLLVQRRPELRALGCLALAVAAFFSWALLAIGAWAAVVTLVRAGPRRALVLAVGCGLAVLAFNGVLALAVGYDPIGSLRATEAYYRNSVASKRPYAFWVLGSPVAFAVALGPPTALAALHAATRRSPAAIGLITVIAIASVAGFTKAETERIWLPFVPLACVAAAEVLGAERLRWVAPLLAAQALVVVVLFQTIW